VVARFLDTEEVTGSNPVSPTRSRLLTCGNARAKLETWGICCCERALTLGLIVRTAAQVGVHRGGRD